MEGDLQQKTAAYLTHELRAPLAAIQCALDILNESVGSELPEERRNMLLIAMRNARRLQDLINDILDLSRLQSGRMNLFPVPCPPAKILKDAVESLLPSAQKKGVRLTAVASEGCPEVSADFRRSAQVLVNLVSNAIKFTPAGGSVEVRAETGVRDDAGYVAFSVRDTGCGIAPEDLKKIFRYFVQVGDKRREGEGTGLGLALARSLVELQGGTLGVESEPGKGTTFRFTLPVHIPLKEKEPISARPRPQSRPA
ncbi:MAG: HAMP domain-containing sensor histidine kinase [Elusimicrobiota bacterium]